MQPVSRRNFLQTLGFFAFSIGSLKGAAATLTPDTIYTVLGPVNANQLGTTLIHEHILVDFIGASEIHADRWNQQAVIKKVLPFLHEIKRMGCSSFIDCTPNYLGRDVVLLQRLAERSGLNIITNTGYYGGSDNKFLPAHAFTETAEALASRWTGEFKNGFGDSNIKPGFIKISVNSGTLSDISKKLITAAAQTHLRTGLSIASHTGPFLPASEQIEILKREGVHPGAFIWVHAQNEPDVENYIKAADEGAWISLDGLADHNVDSYLSTLSFLKQRKVLHHVLVSHDAGWYDPGKPDGGEFRGYTTLFKQLIPAMKINRFNDEEIKLLTEINPQQAFKTDVKALKR